MVDRSVWNDFKHNDKLPEMDVGAFILDGTWWAPLCSYTRGRRADYAFAEFSGLVAEGTLVAMPSKGLRKLKS